MKSESTKGIAKTLVAIDKETSKLQKIRARTVCECKHRDSNGAINLFRAKEPGSAKYICKVCKKPINLKGVDLDSVIQAVDILDAACDTIKLSISVDNPDDRDLCERLSKAQHRNKYVILPAYKAVRSNLQKKNDHRNDSNRGTVWVQPSRG